jgi:hypothetical protein
VPLLGPTPAVVFILLLTIWHLFRVSAAFGLMNRCLPSYEFWTSTNSGSWPLLGSFALVFCLLLAWCVASLLNPTTVSISDRRILVFSAAVIVAALYGFWSIFGAIQVQYQYDSGELAWNDTNPFWFGTEECEASKPFLGEWAVASSSLPSLEDPLPYERVTISRDLSVVATGTDKAIVHDGWFGPPGTNWYEAEVGWLSAGRLRGRWKFSLEEDRLTLESQSEQEDFSRTIVLERVR